MNSLTDKEKQLITDCGRLMNGFREIQEDLLKEFPEIYEKYTGDWNELALYIHQLQNWVMSNAAARSYPKEFRGFGVAHSQAFKDSLK